MQDSIIPLLRVRHLHIAFPGATRPVVNDVSFSLERGKTLGIIGESGSGKSLTGLAILGMLPGRAEIGRETEISFIGNNICALTFAQWRGLRGKEIGVVFQEPMSSLNPLMRVGNQVLESVIRNGDAGCMTKKSALVKTESLFEEVGLAFSKSALLAYPHEYSGGMQQRVMIAMALAGNPSLLIADEPTSALDLTVQSQILKILKEAQERRNMAMLFISHDLDIVNALTHDVLVMHQGVCEEYGPTEAVFSSPAAAYTKYLLQNRLSTETSTTAQHAVRVSVVPKESAPTEEPLVLRLQNASIGYGSGVFTAPHVVLRDVSLGLQQGKYLGIVGESGSGKSSLAKAVMGMAKLLKGNIELFGRNIQTMSAAEKWATSRRCQIISQNTYTALNPRLSVKNILAEPLLVHGLPCSPQLIQTMLEEVGLRDAHAEAYPHQLSGGQRQRVNIARALALNPEIVLCDEIVSALDVSVQSQILHLLRGIQERRRMSLVFISHDLRVIKYMADDVLVLKSGDMIEHGPVDTIWSRPEHAYTRLLFSSAPDSMHANTELAKAV